MSKKTQQSLSFEKDGLILLQNQLAIKDNECRYVALTDSIKKRIGFQKVEDVIGITDRDIKCEAAEFADVFIKQDKKIMASKEPKQFLDYRRNESGDFKISFAEKAPIICDDIVAGLSVSVIDVNLTDFNQFGMWIINLVAQEKSSRANLQYAFFEIGELINSNLKLTERQKEVLFFLLRGQRAVDIAEQLFLSKRTVEGHIEGLKIKFNCARKTELIEKAIADGYLTLLPKQFFNKLK